jgi:hypothetical protein
MSFKARILSKESPYIKGNDSMKRSQFLPSLCALLAAFLLTSCVHPNDSASNVSAGPNRMKTPVHKVNKSKMSVVGYELIQVRGPNAESPEARHERLIRSGKIPLTYRRGGPRVTGEIQPPREVRRNPARRSTWGAEQPAVMQEKSRVSRPVPDEVTF